MYKEFATGLVGGGFTRNDFYGEDEIASLSERAVGKAVYESLAYYVEPTHESDYVMDLAFDFDSKEDLSIALSEAKKVFAALYDREVVATPYFSGGKGFHLVVPWQCVGVAPCSDLAEKYAIMAEDVRKRLQLKTIDLSLYQKRRLLRSVGSLHLESGLYKTKLDDARFMEMELPEILGLAKVRVCDRSFVDTTLCEKVQKVIMSIKPKEKLVPDKKDIGVKVKDVLDRLGVEYRKNVIYENGEPTSMVIWEDKNCVNRFSGKREANGDLYAVIMNFRGCSFAQAQEWLEEEFGVVADIPVATSDEISNGIGEYFATETLEWGVSKHGITKLPLLKRGFFGFVVGSHGSGKTEFTYNMALHNAKQGREVVFLSLEMTATELVSRRATSAIGYTQEYVDQHPEVVAEVQAESIHHQHPNLKIISKPEGMDEVPKDWIEKVIKKFTPDLIVLDNFNMIEASGSDNKWQAQDKTAEFLKRFASSSKCCIVGVHHLNKNAARLNKKPQEYTLSDMEGTQQIANKAMWGLIVGKERGLDMDCEKKDRDKFWIHSNKDRMSGHEGYGCWYFFRGKFLNELEYDAATRSGVSWN